MHAFYFLLLLCIFPFFAVGQEGKFINPITDICWDCIYPIHIAGANVTPSYKDFTHYNKTLCHCPKGLIGVPISFWEPTRLIDVTRTPYKLIGFGGVSLAKGDIKKRGTASQESGQSSFYHVHYYMYPVFQMLDLAKDFVCTESFPLDIGYMSEFDPFWGDDKWSSILNPEALLFANPISQVACIADCMATNFTKPIDKLFWCAGCQGSLYPLVGHVTHHVGGIQASSLLVHRLLAKLHSLSMLWGYEKDNFCNKKPFHRIKKSLYKTQLIYPVSQTKGPCNSLGKSDLIWGSGKSFPYKGEEFIYLIWTKKHCCLDPAKIAIHGFSGGVL